MRYVASRGAVRGRCGRHSGGRRGSTLEARANYSAVSVECVCMGKAKLWGFDKCTCIYMYMYMFMCFSMFNVLCFVQFGKPSKSITGHTITSSAY